jgi:hypothetical protein
MPIKPLAIGITYALGVLLKLVFRLVGQLLTFAFVGFGSFAAIAVITNIAIKDPPTWVPVAALGVSLVLGFIVALRVGRGSKRVSGPTAASMIKAEAADSMIKPEITPAPRPIDPSPSVIPSAGKGHHVNERAKGRFRISPVRVGVAVALVAIVANSINNVNVSQLARYFVEEHAAEIRGPVTVERVDVPLTALLMSSYEVTITLHRDSEPDELMLLRPRVDGSCLFSECSISVRRWELMGL